MHPADLGEGQRREGQEEAQGLLPLPRVWRIVPPEEPAPNRLLTKVAEMAWQHPGLQSRDLCKVHQELLKLFCEDDQSPICVVCRESREHRPHRVVPVEVAMQEHTGAWAEVAGAKEAQVHVC